MAPRRSTVVIKMWMMTAVAVLGHHRMVFLAREPELQCQEMPATGIHVVLQFQRRPSLRKHRKTCDCTLCWRGKMQRLRLYRDSCKSNAPPGRRSLFVLENTCKRRLVHVRLWASHWCRASTLRILM